MDQQCYVIKFDLSFCLVHNDLECSELKTLEWDILNPDRIINLEIKNERRTSNI